MSRNSMWVAFPHGGIIPADVAGGAEKKVGPHEAVSVPRTYGEHLVHDRFAYEADEPKKRKVKTPSADETAAVEKQIADLVAKAASTTDTIEKDKLEAEADELRKTLEGMRQS